MYTVTLLGILWSLYEAVEVLMTSKEYSLDPVYLFIISLVISIFLTVWFNRSTIKFNRSQKYKRYNTARKQSKFCMNRFKWN